MRKPTILYIDDDQFNVILFEYTFKNEFEVLCATSGIDALNFIINNDEIRAVISDVRMPEMSGIQFITKVKEIREKLPCFMLTGYGDDQEVIDALDKNLIVGYFGKPFDKESIIITLKSTIND